MTRGSKYILGVLAVAALLVAGSLVAYAQGEKRMGGPAHFGRMLNLTPEQQASARTIFQGARTAALGVLTPAQQQQWKKDAAHLRQHGQQRREKMMKSLNLTADQQARMKAIHSDARAQAQSIRKDGTLSKDEQNTRLMNLRQETRQKMHDVLTPAQQAQMQAFRAQHGPSAMVKREADRLQLTAGQRGQLQDIFDKAKTDFRQILTPAQQQQFDTISKNRGWDSLSIR